jgi:hypothetical protein
MVIATAILNLKILKTPFSPLSVENTGVEPVTVLKAFGTHKRTTIDSPVFCVERSRELSNFFEQDFKLFLKTNYFDTLPALP